MKSWKSEKAGNRKKKETRKCRKSDKVGNWKKYQKKYKIGSSRKSEKSRGKKVKN